MTRLVVSKINATPLAKNVKTPDWIEGIHRLTAISIEWKLFPKNVTNKKAIRNTIQTENRPHSFFVNFRYRLFTSHAYNNYQS